MYQNPLQDPIIQKFNQLLERLTRNDSRIIQCLSKIAEDYQNTTEYTQIFTSQLMGSIFQSESLRKVYYLYVLDCILKVVGGPYIELFSPFLGEIFIHVYQFSTPQSQRQMHTIFETWKVIIPNNFLEKIPKQIIFPPLDQEQASKIEFFKQQVKSKQSNKSPTLSPTHQEAQTTQTQQQEVQQIQTESNLNQDSKNSEILAFIKQTPFSQLPDVLLQNLINSNNILEELLQTQQTEFLVFAELARRFRGKIEKSNLESRQSFNVEINQLETRYEEVIKRLYEDIPFRCAVCGLRFESHGLLTKHLDDHFEQKKEDRITQQ